MALTKITSRILDSSGVTILGTIATGVWQGTAINQTYLVGQSGTNTGDETLARINALDVTELGTVSSGVWNGTAIASAYLDADTAHLSTTQTFTGAKTFSSAVLIQQSGSTGFVTEKTGGTGSFINLKDNAGTVFIGGVNNEFVVQTSGSSYSNKLTISNAGNATFSGNVGIGVSPSAKLTVKGGTSTFVHDNEPQGTASSVYRDAVFGSTQTVNTGITIFGTGQTGISFGDAASHIRGQVRYQHSSDTLELGSAGNINMSISSGGAATFSGGGVFSNSSQGKVKLIASSDEYSSLEFANASGTTQWEISKNNTHDLYFYKGGYKMILKSGGNVGIGTTSPLQLLDVQSSTASPKIMVKVNGQAGTTNPTAELILGAGPISSNDSACKIISFRTANYSSAAARSSGLKFQVTQNNGPRLALTIAETGVVSIPNGIVLDSNTTGGTPNATNVTLNAYEEGTWTPTLSVSGVSYTKQEGKYTRIGNVVHYWIDINFTATSGYIIYNLYLPFTTSFSSFYGSAAIGNAYRINLGTGGTMLGGYYSVNYIRLHSSGNSTGQLSPIATGGNMTIRMEGIYQAL